MHILFVGDIVGKSGRVALLKYLPELKSKFALDAIIVNGENAAHGFGLTPKMYKQFLENGVDVVTMGNHTFDKKDIYDIMDEEFLVRPLNYPENTLGHGWCIKKLPNGKRLAVVQLLGNVLMPKMDNPFAAVDAWIKKHQNEYDILVVDMHAEATSEKIAMGFFLDGRATLVVGTHTHIPTADAHVLENGTAYITDLGMTGDYVSVIGSDVKSVVDRYVAGLGIARAEIPEKEGTLCGVIIETDDRTNMAKKIFSVRLGPHLENTPNL